MFNKEKFKELRKQKHLSQTDIAKELGKSYKTVMRWELGINDPSEYNIIKLAEILNISVKSISDVKEKTDNIPLFYDKLGSLDKTTYDFSTKTETEKQKIFFNNERNLKTALWDSQENKRLYDSILNLLDSLYFFVYKKNKQLKFTYTNKYFLNYFNFSDSNLILGKRNENIWFDKNSWNELTKLEKKVLETKTGIYNHKITIPCLYGPKSIGIVSLIPVFDNDHNVAEITGSILDISEDEMTKEKYFYIESILDRIEHAILIIKTKPFRHYIYVNKAIEKIYNISSNECYLDVNVLDKYRYKNDIARSNKKFKTPEKEYDHRIQVDSGEIKWVQDFYHKCKINDEEFEFWIIKDITERKKAGEIRELLEINLNSANDGIVIIDEETHEFMYLNQAFATIFKSTKEELYKLTVLQFLKEFPHHEDIKKINELYDADPIITYRVTLLDKTIKWVEKRGISHNYFGKKCKISIIRDVTKRKNNETVKDLYHKTMNESCIGTWLLDRNRDTVIYINDTFAKNYGYPSVNFQNNYDFWFNNCLHPDDLKQELEYKRLKSYPTKRRFRFIKPDGEIRLMEEIINTTPEYLLGVQRDVTESVKTEEVNKLLEVNLNFIEDGVIIIDDKTQKYLYLNKAVEKIFQLPLVELHKLAIDSIIKKFIHPDDEKIFNDSTTKTEIVRYRIILPDKSIKWLERRGVYHTYLGKKCKIAIIRDITDSKLEKIEEKNKLKSIYKKALADNNLKIANKMKEIGFNHKIIKKITGVLL
ncbi:MAG: PAS domain S-box protein [bacterium]|nr:PAS domain S-box protein [bacterium]